MKLLRGGQTHHPCFFLGSPHLSAPTSKPQSQGPVLDWCARQVFTSGLTQRMAQMWAGTPQSHCWVPLVLQVLPSATASPGLLGYAPQFALACSDLQWLSPCLREKPLLPAPGGCCCCPRDLAPVPTLVLVPTEQRQLSSPLARLQPSYSLLKIPLKAAVKSCKWQGRSADKRQVKAKWSIPAVRWRSSLT